MIVRSYEHKEDAKRVDDYTEGNKYGLKIDRDVIILAEAPGFEGNTIKGVAAGQPVFYVHHFMVSAGGFDRLAAEELLSYSLGLMKAKGEKNLVFVVDPKNEKMLRFMKDKGAERLPEGILFKLEVR